MSEWKVNSRQAQTRATYMDGGYRVDVVYTEDATTSTLSSVSGDIYRKENTSHAGDFNGNRNTDGEMSYSINGVRIQEMVTVTNMIADIEARIRSDRESEKESE